MSSLRALQQELREQLFFRERAKPSTLWRDGAPARLAIYRHNVRSNWTDTLDYDFPLTKRQFADDEWAALAQRFFQKYPPRHWELNASLIPFTSFLRSQKIKPYVKELADWEWHDLRIFIDPAVVKSGTGMTNPTMAVRVYQHQMFDWVDAGAPGDRPPPQKPEVLVFYRDAKNTCHIREADPLMLLMLEHFKKPGASLEALEPQRQKLLPGNRVALATVATALRKDGLVL